MKLLFFLLLFLLNQVNFSQEYDLSGGMYVLSEYISQLKVSDTTDNELNKLDSIFIKSNYIYQNNPSDALLACTFTTLPFKEMEIKLPLVNINLTMHLPSVDEPLFGMKNKKLPKNYIINSSESDIDKTAHFFANAYLGYSAPKLGFSDYLGKMVELFEYTLKVDGKVDTRDLEINNLGLNFGQRLRENKAALPSQFFKIYNYLKISAMY